MRAMGEWGTSLYSGGATRVESLGWKACLHLSSSPETAVRLPSMSRCVPPACAGEPE